MLPELSSITLLGSSSGRNAGDAALIAAIMDGVDAACGRELLYEIPTIRPDYIRDFYPNRTRPVGMMPWHGALRMLGLPTIASLGRTDAAVVFDACLFDRSLYNPLFNFMSSLALLLPRVKKQGKPVIGYNVGVGPVFTPAGQKMLKGIADDMDFITVRDTDSLELLQEVGVENPRIRLTADAAVNAPAWTPGQVAPLYEKHGLELDEPKLAINVNRYLDTWADADRESMGKEKFLDVFAAALEKVHAEIGVPVVFVSTQHHDVELSEELAGRLSKGVKTACLDNREIGHAGAKGVLRHVDLLCGMRLHSLILASSELTPVVGITYQPKVAYYFRELEQPGRTLSFDDFTPEALAEHILSGWRDRAALKASLETRMPVLKRRAAWSGDLVAAFGKGRDTFEALWDEGPGV